MPKRIRVLELIFAFAVEAAGGGIGRFNIALSRALDKERFDVGVCALWDMGTPYERDWVRRLNAEGVQAFSLAKWEGDHPYRSFWSSYGRLRDLLATQPVDILHSHSEFSDIAALALKLSLKPAPLILRTLHNGFRSEWRKRPLRRLLLTNLLYPFFFDAEIGVSQHVAGNLDRRWLAARLGRHAHCLYNAVDLERFSHPRVDRRELRLRLGIPEEAFVVGSVGRLMVEKGYTDLVTAAAQVSAQLPQAFFMIVGDGELRDGLGEHARRLGLGDKLLFTGARSDVEDLLGCMDLFVSTSLWEGLSTAVLEGMAAGVPVIATDIPGNRELVEPGQSGWIIPPQDPGALAAAILEAWRAEKLRRDFARCAAMAVNKYSIEKVASAHQDLYERLVTSRRQV